MKGKGSIVINTNFSDFSAVLSKNIGDFIQKLS
jgi:hypothetical protein